MPGGTLTGHLLAATANAVLTISDLPRMKQKHLALSDSWDASWQSMNLVLDLRFFGPGPD